MEGSAECSDYDSNNNNNRDESIESKTNTNTTNTNTNSAITDTTSEDDLSALPLAVPVPVPQQPLFLDFPTPDALSSHGLPDAELFTADPAFMESLTEEHGFSETAARKALYWTRNDSLASALLWLCDRCPSTYETPLEDELEQMKEEFESINQRAVSKMLTSNPEIFGSINSLDTEEMISASEEETEEEELELVVILNRRSSRRMTHSQVIAFTKEAVKDLVYNISLTSDATDRLYSWEEGSTPDALIGWAEGTLHMTDLEMCSSSLSLHTGLAGIRWDPLKLRYRDFIALAVWGNSTEVQKAVGNLIPVSARK